MTFRLGGFQLISVIDAKHPIADNDEDWGRSLCQPWDIDSCEYYYVLNSHA
jgi:hypothetical protein